MSMGSRIRSLRRLRGTTDLHEVRRRQWFYRFELPDGTATDPYVPADVATIHDARWEMAHDAITETFGSDLATVEAVDLGCHQGWFTAKLLEAGAGSVVGVDVRPEHLDDAELIVRVLGHEAKAKFQRFDFNDPSAFPLTGEFDLVLMLGLIYHLENPVGALRLARQHTRRLCLVETQIAPSLGGVTDCGSYRYTTEIVGNFAVHDETLAVTAGIREANMRTISLFPDIRALLFVMGRVGFDRVSIIEPSPLNEQLANGKRAMVAGWVDADDHAEN